MTDITLFNCYDELRVLPRSSYDEIKSAFRALAKQHHPDVSPGASEEAQIRLNHAYEILVDPVLRVWHDRHWLKPEARSARREAGTERNRTTASRARARRKHDAKDKAGRTKAGRSTAPQWKAATDENETAGNGPAPTSFERVSVRVREAIREKEETLARSFDERWKRNAADLSKKFKNMRVRSSLGAFVTCACFAVSFVSPLALGVAILSAAFLIVPALRIDIEYDHVFAFSPTWKVRVERAAKLGARAAIDTERDGHARFLKILRIMKEETIRGSRKADTERSVAGRLALSFFFMGYTPSGYDRRTRTIRFSIGGDTVLVRYRHRRGVPTNIAYVKKLAELMAESSASAGYLFCTPGLSGKALEFGRGHGIASYTLGEMNEWMKQAYSSGHQGPAGSILDALDTLARFIRELAGVA